MTDLELANLLQSQIRDLFTINARWHTPYYDGWECAQQLYTPEGISYYSLEKDPQRGLVSYPRKSQQEYIKAATIQANSLRCQEGFFLPDYDGKTFLAAFIFRKRNLKLWN